MLAILQFQPDHHSHQFLLLTILLLNLLTLHHAVAPNNIPSDPPPEYTPTVSTNVPVPVAPVNENSTVAS